LSDVHDDLEGVEAIHLHLSELTDRERQVFWAVVEGLANKTIAYDLNISSRTVEVHRANVMSKMKAKSLPELVRMALAAKLDIK
jgi:two-component system response regulator FixJ